MLIIALERGLKAIIAAAPLRSPPSAHSFFARLAWQQPPRKPHDMNSTHRCSHDAAWFDAPQRAPKETHCEGIAPWRSCDHSSKREALRLLQPAVPSPCLPRPHVMPVPEIPPQPCPLRPAPSDGVRIKEKNVTSIGSTSWAITTSLAFFSSTREVTWLSPILTATGRLEAVLSPVKGSPNTCNLSAIQAEKNRLRSVRRCAARTAKRTDPCSSTPVPVMYTD